jgi:hypothetical protein
LDSPVLLHLFGIEDADRPPSQFSPEAIKEKTFDTLCRLSIKGSLQRLLVLLLEDLHWIDKISEEFLGYLGVAKQDGLCLAAPTVTGIARSERAPDGRLDFRWLGGERVAQPSELPAQIVDLVEQSKDQRQRFVVDRKFPADLDDQLHPCNIDLVKDPGLATSLGQHPAVFNPTSELAPVEPHEAVEQLLECNHPDIP